MFGIKRYRNDLSEIPLAPPRAPSRQRFELDQPLLSFSPKDHWTLRDACQGTQIMGGTGSGKTSGTGRAIAMAFLRAGFGGLVLCAKPVELREYDGKPIGDAATRIIRLAIVDPQEKSSEVPVRLVK